MMQDAIGRVLKCVGGLFDVLTEEADAPRRISCRARGVLRRGEGRVLVGDFVRLSEDDAGHGIAVAEVLSRRNALIRPPLANLDGLLVVAAATDPAPIPETIDKLLAILEHNAISATVVVTKADLDPAAAEALAALYRAAGYEAFCVSSHADIGLGPLSAYIRARLARGEAIALAGASGVGKSSLINALFPDLACETGEISRKTARGKNTTRVTELHPLCGGFLADTPGFSLLDFLRFDFFGCDDLPHAFREFAPYLGKCRYGDCAHIKEEECAVRAAVARGEIAASRYESYAALYPILRAKKSAPPKKP